ncbi:tobamovirus multiplication protein 1-like [Rutidosis leptorrhynchoides]|uniref:tobamovirus multiplication protein 1-like n=1 Tax=Rutidosis leptorrhynchoides TaxID=125765 RepID=UPI003A991085
MARGIRANCRVVTFFPRLESDRTGLMLRTEIGFFGVFRWGINECLVMQIIIVMAIWIPSMDKQSDPLGAYSDRDVHKLDTDRVRLFDNGGHAIFEWWNDNGAVDESQNSIYYALSVSYAFVSVVALVQLIRIQLRVPEYGWTTQKVFHLMNFIVNAVRAVQLGFYEKVFLIRPKALELVLLDLPTLLFFSTYTLLVLFWAEIYHQARSLPTDKLRPAYYIVNGIVYFIQVCIWVAIRLSGSSFSIELAKLFLSVISLSAAVGFLIYGGRLFVMLRRFPIESRGRQKKLYEVGCVTGICCSCFLTRCIVVTLSVFNENSDLDVLDHPVLNFMYYALVEIVPSGLVLFILRKLPPKRVSDQYHPIQ